MEKNSGVHFKKKKSEDKGEGIKRVRCRDDARLRAGGLGVRQHKGGGKKRKTIQGEQSGTQDPYFMQGGSNGIEDEENLNGKKKS